MIRAALAGQPNCGKSTIFNMLAGVNQHVANYPGVTVDKKTANLKYKDQSIELVDLPGTYSFSTYSLEEKVAKDFLIDSEIDVIINVVDSSCLRRSLLLTLQLLELGKPVIVVLNMMDIAEGRGLVVSDTRLQELINVRTIKTVGAKKLGKAELLDAVIAASEERISEPFKLNYGELEPYIKELSEQISINAEVCQRWLAVKCLEGDQGVLERTGIRADAIKDLTRKIHNIHDLDIDQAVAGLRYENAHILYHKIVDEKGVKQDTMTARVDRVMLNQWFAFPVLGLVIYLIYELSIVWGYKLTDYTWPFLAALKNKIVSFLPAGAFVDVPLVTDFGIWMTNSVIALLNYVPIFFILFALIAILEDVGYMPRMAFILDRVFKRYGLHGQSTLPLVLGGAFVGGCAVPGIMATKGIADERARLATILTVPYMNCLAKVPFYTLLLGAFFKADMALMMFFISTVTLFIALIVARVLTATVLVNRETAPFVMELPTYHLPTFKGVTLRATQRVWVYVKKVVTVVMAVAVILFVLLQYPGVSDEKMAQFRSRADVAMSGFAKKAASTSYVDAVDEPEELGRLVNLYDDYKAHRMLASSKEAVAALDQQFQQASPDLFALVRPDNPEAKKLNRQLRRLSKTNKQLQMEIKNEKITNSFLGMIGRALEPVSQFCGFDWRINVAFLSSFAARESAVATLGSIYEQGKTDLTPEESMAQDGAYTPIHAASMLIFMILTPPCIATMVVVKLQANSYRWMLFAIGFPISLGIIVSALFFTLAVNFGWSGLELMRNFYLVTAVLALVLGVIKTKQSGWQASRTH